MFICVDRTSCGIISILVFLELFGPIEQLCQVREASNVLLCSVRNILI